MHAVSEDIHQNILRPQVIGPDFHYASIGPPTFEIMTGVNSFFLIELTTKPELLIVKGRSRNFTPDNYYASCLDSTTLLVGSRYTLPSDAWDRLNHSKRLYYRIWTSAKENGWVNRDVSTRNYRETPYIRILPKPPTPNSDLQGLLNYLHITNDDFAMGEVQYFRKLKELLKATGVIGDWDTIDRDTFGNAVRKYQSQTGELEIDGIPGEETLWTLQRRLIKHQKLDTQRVSADIWGGPPSSDNDIGFDFFRLREDLVARYNLLRDSVLSKGGIITSAGALRDLDALVGQGRSTMSFHYTGLAFDMALPTGMQNPEVDPFIVTEDNEGWRIYARAVKGVSRTLRAVTWEDGRKEVRHVTAQVIDFTYLAKSFGFRCIGPHDCFPRDYICAEWWHFQCEDLLTPWISQFGIEILRLARNSESELQNQRHLWENRTRIFKRGINGWH